MPIGTNVEGKMVAALRRLGFDKVFDTNFGADVTIVEEANELVERVKNGGVLPMITSCSPGWVKFAEYYYPDLLPHLSSCKSPQQMFGGILKTYYAEKNGIDPKDIVSVSIMPCTAKKFEIGRDDQDAAGLADVDIALTTRELARMIDRAGIKFPYLPDEEFDSPMGEDTGAAVIFGATGGVMEAALRTANDWLTGKDNGAVEFKEVRGTARPEGGHLQHRRPGGQGGGGQRHRGRQLCHELYPGRHRPLDLCGGHVLPRRLRQRRRASPFSPPRCAMCSTSRPCAPKRCMTRTPA